MFKLNNTTEAQVGPFGLTKQVQIAASSSYEVSDLLINDFALDQNLIAAVQSGVVTVTAGLVTFDKYLALGYLESVRSMYIRFLVETPDQRGVAAINRIPSGYTIYPTGAGDNVANNTYGNGEDIILTNAEPTKSFQFLHHFYAIGGRATFEGCDLTSKVNAWLVAPASTGWTQATGDYNKYNVGGPFNMLIPVTPGTGSWNVDLTAKLGATTILASTPVPAAGNNGWFDYDSDTNMLTRNMTQTGGYNLYDFDINLFKFGNQLPGSKLDGMQLMYEATDVVGKLLFNSWKMKFTLTPGAENSAAKVGIVLITAAKKNL